MLNKLLTAIQHCNHRKYTRNTFQTHYVSTRIQLYYWWK